MRSRVRPESGEQQDLGRIGHRAGKGKRDAGVPPETDLWGDWRVWPPLPALSTHHRPVPSSGNPWEPKLGRAGAGFISQRFPGPKKSQLWKQFHKLLFKHCTSLKVNLSDPIVIFGSFSNWKMSNSSEMKRKWIHVSVTPKIQFLRTSHIYFWEPLPLTNYVECKVNFQRCWMYPSSHIILKCCTAWHQTWPLDCC